MKTFEYKVVKLPIVKDHDDLKDRLNHLGGDGWELCASEYSAFIFKREKRVFYLGDKVKFHREPDEKFFTIVAIKVSDEHFGGGCGFKFLKPDEPNQDESWWSYWHDSRHFSLVP